MIVWPVPGLYCVLSDTTTICGIVGSQIGVLRVLMEQTSDGLFCVTSDVTSVINVHERFG